MTLGGARGEPPGSLLLVVLLVQTWLGGDYLSHFLALLASTNETQSASITSVCPTCMEARVSPYRARSGDLDTASCDPLWACQKEVRSCALARRRRAFSRI